MAKPTAQRRALEQELHEIQTELADLERQPVIERPRFEALKARVRKFQGKLTSIKE